MSGPKRDRKPEEDRSCHRRRPGHCPGARAVPARSRPQVAQVSKPAVSPTSKSAARAKPESRTKPGGYSQPAGRAISRRLRTGTVRAPGAVSDAPCHGLAPQFVAHLRKRTRCTALANCPKSAIDKPPGHGSPYPRCSIPIGSHPVNQLITTTAPVEGPSPPPKAENSAVDGDQGGRSLALPC